MTPGRSPTLCKLSAASLIQQLRILVAAACPCWWLGSRWTVGESWWVVGLDQDVGSEVGHWSCSPWPALERWALALNFPKWPSLATPLLSALWESERETSDPCIMYGVFSTLQFSLFALKGKNMGMCMFVGLVSLLTIHPMISSLKKRHLQ